MIPLRKCLEIIAATNGEDFSIRFIKRSTGEIRTMTCRMGDTEHLKGGKPAYNFEEKGIIPVFDVDKGGYRSISIEGIVMIYYGDKWVEVTHPEKEKK